jgi:type IV pilus assembly protein PilA
MKSEFKAKFLSHLLKRKDNEGFTLIELLVVIIIIGILSAIALPSFLNQASKAKQSEAKNYVGAVQRAQQSYRIEKQSFAPATSTLEIGIPTQTDNYTYGMNATRDTTTFVARTLDSTALKGFSSGVVVLTTGQTSAISCQTTATQSVASVAVPGLSTSTGASCSGTMENMK